jgi:hypothetical protein
MYFLPEQPNAKADLVAEVQAMGKVLKDHYLRVTWFPDTQRWLVDKRFTNSRAIQLVKTPRDTIHELCTHLGFFIGGVDYETPYDAGMQMLREFGVENDLVEVVLPPETPEEKRRGEEAMHAMFGPLDAGSKWDSWQVKRKRAAAKEADKLNPVQAAARLAACTYDASFVYRMPGSGRR